MDVLLAGIGPKGESGVLKGFVGIERRAACVVVPILQEG